MSAFEESWAIEEVVRAQCMACDGADLETIARALGRSPDEVRRRLDPDREPPRPQFAALGYPHLKTHSATFGRMRHDEGQE